MTSTLIAEWEKARKRVTTVAVQKEWPEEAIRAAWSLVDRAADSTGDTTSFYRELRRLWVTGVPQNPPASWPDLLPVWAAAIHEELGEQEKEWVQSWIGIAAQTAEKSADDARKLPEKVSQVGSGLLKIAAAFGTAYLLKKAFSR